MPKFHNFIRFFWLLILSLSTGNLTYAQMVTTIAGQAEVVGNIDGDAITEALFNNPHGICVDSSGMLYIADRWNHKIRTLDTRTGLVATLAGTGQIGSDDGPGEVARFYEPWGITCSPDGVVYVADTKNYLIRKIDKNGVVSTIAGAGSFGVQDGPAMTARFAEPSGIALADDGTLFICDHIGHTIRKLSTSGQVSTIAGQAFVEGDADGVGSVARFYRPFDIDLDNDGNILVADEWNHKIRRVTPNGFTSTVAGFGSLGSDDGHVDDARFNYPWDVAMDTAGVIYVMDGFNYTIRRIENDSVSTYCGTVRATGAIDGFADQASFSGATAIVIEEETNILYVADAFNELIRKVETSTGVGLISTPILPSGDTICLGSFADFAASPDYYANYDFFINDVLIQSSASFEFPHSFNTAGQVRIKVVATHSEGWTVESPESQYQVIPIPDSDFNYEFISGDTNAFTVRFLPFDTTAVSYFWDFGDPTSGSDNFSTLMKPTHTYNALGPFDVQLAISGGGVCKDTSFKAGFVGLLALEASPISALDTICLGDTVLFSASTQIYETYRFYVNGNQVSNGLDTEYLSVPTQAGDYVVYVEGIDQSGRTFTSQNFAFYVADYPQSGFDYMFVGEESGGYRVDFINESSGAQSYVWNFGDPASGTANISTISNPSHIYASVGEYDVQLISIGYGGCADTLLREDFVALLGLNAFDPASLNGGSPIQYFPNDSICTGESALFRANSSQYQSYEFYLNNTLVQNSASHEYSTSFANAGLYEVKIIGVEPGGRRIESPTFPLQVLNYPVSDFSVEVEGINPAGYAVTFLNLAQNAGQYRWDFGDPGSGPENQSTLINPQHTYAEFGAYTVRLISIAGGQCADTLSRDSAVVFIDVPSNLFIPNAFTPNGDGQNDVLYLLGNNITALDWMIFNQWGELIFQTSDPAKGWDGYFRGRIVQPDTYVYLAKVTLANGQRETLKGQITLIR